MTSEREHILHCLLYEYDLGNTAGGAHQKITQIMGQDSVSRRTCYKWFDKFKAGDRSLKDEERSGRPQVFDDGKLRALVEADPRLTTRCMAAQLGCAHSTVYRHLIAMGKVLKLGSWVPHVLTESDRGRRSDTCLSLLSRRRNFHWLDDVITGDEKWALYVTRSRHRQWVSVDQHALPEPKPDLHEKKLMLSVWWDSQGIIYHEFLPHNVTITAAYYSAQLDRLKSQLTSVRPGRNRVVFLHDNARPHTAMVTREKLLQLGWEVLPHPAHSPDIAPSDFHLFRALDNHLRGKSFSEENALKMEISQFFASKPASFYKQGIHALPERWRKIVEHDGTYIVE